GNSYRLRIVDKQEVPLRFDNGFYLARWAKPQAKEIFTDWYKKMATAKLAERTEHYARSTGIEYRTVKITSATRRLGSCSPDGTLTFPWRLIMAPLQVIDYVIVHELVHVEEKNHSQRFWEKVKVIIPDYESAREWLKNNWHRLKL
ncbi:MAG: M48 family metallopeptidase, partial [candidate division WOR-3 bacterium]